MVTESDAVGSLSGTSNFPSTLLDLVLACVLRHTLEGEKGGGKSQLVVTLNLGGLYRFLFGESAIPA